MADLDRPDFRRRIATLFRTHPLVGILGPRQCGKTTLARDHLAARPEPRVHYFDLEDPEARSWSACCSRGSPTSASGR